MRISLYSSKGGAGKTPLSLLFAIDKEFALATNESYDVHSGNLPDDRLLFVEADQEFPQIPEGIDIVFDLAGTMTKHDYSTLSAIRQSDVVIVPIWNNIGSILGGVKSVEAVAQHTKNIIVVATKLRNKAKGETWLDSSDFQTVQESVKSIESEIGFMPRVLPLKHSDSFETVLSQYTSFHQMAEKSGLAAYTHKELIKQIDDIYAEVARYE